MRHQAEDVSLLIAYARHITYRAVAVLRIAQDELARRLQLAVELVVGIPVSLPVLHRDGQLLPELAAAGEQRVRALDTQADVAADELEIAVPAQHAGQHPGLAEDLETVADAEHGTARVREPRTASSTGAKRAIAPQRR